MSKGRVIKAVAGAFSVETEQETILCSVRGRVKKDVDIFVGDFVEAEDNVIVSVYPRKNQLIRPYVANIDLLFIVVAPLPEPDWVLVEKLLLNCKKEGIEGAILYNKCDRADGEKIEEFLRPYREEARTFTVSAKEKIGLDEVKEYIQGKTVCFAGQSAVGKSSLISALNGTALQTGELSTRINRGKNTTRTVEIFDCGRGKVIDTCGFSVAENIDIKPEELIYYYEDFVAVQNMCRFNNCLHLSEPGCKVKERVEKGMMNRDRYTRYVKLYTELKKRRDSLYG